MTDRRVSSGAAMSIPAKRPPPGRHYEESKSGSGKPIGISSGGVEPRMYTESQRQEALN